MKRFVIYFQRHGGTYHYTAESKWLDTPEGNPGKCDKRAVVEADLLMIQLICDSLNLRREIRKSTKRD